MYHTDEKGRGVRVIAFANLIPGSVSKNDDARPPERLPAAEIVIIDLSCVHSLDLAHLMILLRYIAAVRADGGDVGLAAVSGPVRLLVQRMVLHRYVEIFNTVDEVIRSLSLPVHSSEEQMAQSPAEHLAAHLVPGSQPASQEILQ